MDEYLPINIAIEKVAFIPEQATKDASGYDIYAAEDAVIHPNSVQTVKTGLYVEIPSGYEMQIRSRSGLAAKKMIMVLNSPGTIDADYRGEIKVILANFGTLPYMVSVGDRIAQAVFAPVCKVKFFHKEELNPTPRGDGGFGSTGIN